MQGFTTQHILDSHYILCDFNFLNQEEIEKFDVTSITNDSDEGYVLECDLFYPPEIHELHNCYPLCAENRVVEDDEIAPHSRYLFEKLNGTKHKRIKTKKLIPTLYSKKNYIIHYRHLQLCLDLGLKIERIHRIMSFQQKPWLKTYIEYNSIQRRNDKNDLEKTLYKFYNNSVFGTYYHNNTFVISVCGVCTFLFI